MKCAVVCPLHRGKTGGMQAWVVDDWRWLLREDVDRLLAKGYRWRYDPCAGARSKPVLGRGPAGQRMP